MSKLRVACLWFQLPSVGGIATAAATFKRAAQLCGDTWDVLRCPLGFPTTPAQLYPDGPQWIAGGDTRIYLDGVASHHPKQLANTVKWLEQNYDALFFVHPCPHPTSHYPSSEPLWRAMYELPRLPKFMRIGDAHFGTYEWVLPAIPLCKTIFVNQPAYARALPPGVKYEMLPMAFLPSEDPEVEKTPRAKDRWVIWAAQSKTVKGYPAFVRTLKHIDTPLAIFSSGTYYYNLRYTDDWKQGIGWDRYYNERLEGPENHIYYGYVKPHKMPKIFRRAWAAISLQGYAGGKRKEYATGSYNNSEVEELWYGCRPLLHESAAKVIPEEFLYTVQSADDLPRACREVTPLEGAVGKRAREWVYENHNAVKIYKQIKAAVER